MILFVHFNQLYFVGHLAYCAATTKVTGDTIIASVTFDPEPRSESSSQADHTPTTH